jgi:hypothetical protein
MVALLVVLHGPWPDASSAQAPPQTPLDLEAVVATLAANAGTLRSASFAPPPAGPSVSARLESAVRWLRNNAPKSDPALVTREYVASLERAAALLGRQPDPAAVEDVVRELEAKVHHCRTLGVGMGGSVALVVTTRRGGLVVDNRQVQYLLKFDEWLKTPPRTFPRVSSPTEARVEPGRYWIWARDPATGTAGERVLVEVAGRSNFAVDIPVP